MQGFESLGSGQFEIGTSEHFSGCSCAGNGGQLIFVCHWAKALRNEDH